MSNTNGVTIILHNNLLGGKLYRSVPEIECSSAAHHLAISKRKKKWKKETKSRKKGLVPDLSAARLHTGSGWVTLTEGKGLGAGSECGSAAHRIRMSNPTGGEALRQMSGIERSSAAHYRT